MQVRVFESENMQAALKMVKETLGPDALILSTRTLRKGKLGLFGKPMLEVTAAAAAEGAMIAAAQGPASSPPAVDREPSPRPGNRGERRPGTVAADEISYQDLWKQRPVIDPLEEEIREIRRQLAGQDLAAFRGELNELKALVREIAVRQVEREMAAEGKPAGAGELSMLMGILDERGMDAEIAERIGLQARERFTPRQLQERSILDPFLRQAVAGMVRVTGPLTGIPGEQKRVALVGPTGVGKTTTMAKLAAEFLIKSGRDPRRVALVTIDTYRIAAVEQLKVYGGIMNLPVEVVFTPEQLQKAFAAHRDKDLILIDTAGRSPRDEVSLREMCAFLGPEAGTENHLVVAASTTERQLQETTRRFGNLPLRSILFTKLDECDRYGALLNLSVRHDLPLSYLTHGQRVPEDLLQATPQMVTDYVLEK